MIPRPPSTIRQRKNFQTFGLVIPPTYSTLFLELFLLMMRSFMNVCLKTWSQGHHVKILSHLGPNSIILILMWGSLSLRIPVIKLSSIWVTGVFESPYMTRPTWASCAPTSGVVKDRKPTQKSGMMSCSISSLLWLQLPVIPPDVLLITWKWKMEIIFSKCEAKNWFTFTQKATLRLALFIHTIHTLWRWHKTSVYKA